MKLAVIKDVDTFPSRWWSWWTERQPSERISSHGKLIFPDGAVDWSTLDYHGDNGVLSFVVALLSWGLHIENEKSGKLDRRDWLDAVKDLSWTLARMVEDAGSASEEEPEHSEHTKSVPLHSLNLHPTNCISEYMVEQLGPVNHCLVVVI